MAVDHSLSVCRSANACAVAAIAAVAFGASRLPTADPISMYLVLLSMFGQLAAEIDPLRRARLVQPDAAAEERVHQQVVAAAGAGEVEVEGAVEPHPVDRPRHDVDPTGPDRADPVVRRRPEPRLDGRYTQFAGMPFSPKPLTLTLSMRTKSPGRSSQWKEAPNGAERCDALAISYPVESTVWTFSSGVLSDEMPKTPPRHFA